jgi:peptidoglycan/LPS O-acetylase OafA/YrhL
MTQNRILSIDFLRGIAILLVLMVHHPSSPFVLGVIGWSGVDLFFVLSGFLVSGLLFQEYKTTQQIHIKRFWIRRGFKIYPMFYAFFGFTLFAQTYGGITFTLKGLIGELFFLQNYVGLMSGHTWSLAVEEHFYFLLPLLLWLLISRNQGLEDPFHSIPMVCLALGIVCLSLRVYTCMYVEYGVFSHHYPTHLRLDSLFFGVFLSYLFHFHQEKLSLWMQKNRWVCLIISVLLLSTMYVWGFSDFVMNTFGFTWVYLGYGGLLLYFVYHIHVEKCWIVFRWFFGGGVWIGRFSYGIYLWHLAVQFHGTKVLMSCWNVEEYSITTFWVYVIGSILMGALMTYLIEKPFLKLRNQMYA